MKLLLAILGALMLAGAAQAQTPRPSVLTNPDWLSRPNGDDMARAYPKMALQLGIGGRATVGCTVDDLGKLDDCKVVSQLPEGLGFGDAALQMTDAVQMRPMSRDGQPVAGGTVRIPIRFVAPGLAAPEPLPAPQSPRTLELVRELRRLAGSDAALKEKLDKAIREIDFIGRPDASDEARSVIAESLRAEGPSFLARVADASDRINAATFSEAELAAVAAFGRTPEGAAFTRWDADVEAIQTVLQKAATRIARRETRAALCATRRCELDPTLLVRDTDGPRPKVMIPDPDWAAEPGATAVYQAVPQLAQALGIDGAVRLTCSVGPLGGLTGCTVADEAPAGLGFGAAALSLAGRYRVEPALLGKGAAGDTVAAVIHFPIREEDEEQDGKPPGFQPRSAASLKLALGFIDASHDRSAVLSAWRAQMTNPDYRIEGETPEQRAQLLAAIERAGDAAVAEMRNLQAAWLTQQYTDAQLSAGAAMWRTPAGQTWKVKIPTVRIALGRTAFRYGQEMWYAAGARFCRTWECGPGALEHTPAN